jgi:hypothetical protein
MINMATARGSSNCRPQQNEKAAPGTGMRNTKDGLVHPRVPCSSGRICRCSTCCRPSARRCASGTWHRRALGNGLRKSGSMAAWRTRHDLEARREHRAV